MRSWTAKTGKVLSCLLTLLATVQPTFVSLCLCPCRDCESSLSQESCDCEKHCLHSDEACDDCPSCTHCQDSQLGEASSKSWCLGLLPCDCPKECDCHLRHSTPNGSEPTAGPRVTKQQTAASYYCASNWPKPNGLLATFLNRPECGIHLALDAPSSCEVLCRFTI